MSTDDEIKRLSEEIQEHQTHLDWKTGNDRHTLLSRLKSMYLERGKAYQQQGKSHEAIADFAAAISLGKSNDSELDDRKRDRIAECYARRGFAKWKLGEKTEAMFDFDEASEINPEGHAFARIEDENQNDVAANVLNKLYGFASVLPILNAEFLAVIKTDPKPVQALLLSLIGSRADHNVMELIRAIALYEEKGILDISRISIRMKNLNEDDGRLEAALHYPALEKHPVGLLYLGYYHSQRGEIFKAIKTYEAMSKYHPAVASWCNGYIAEDLKSAPQAIQAHIEKREFRMASALAERSGDFSTAAQSYELLAEGIEKGDEGIQESTKLYMGIMESIALNGNTTLNFSSQVYELSPFAAGVLYQSAAECFEKAGNRERAAACLQNARRLKRQSDLQALVDTPETLVLGEWDAITITVTNNGFGAAKNLTANVEGPFTLHGVGTIQEIGVGESTSAEIAFKPNEAGRRVPLTIRFTYQDSTGTNELPPITKLLMVARL